MKTVFGNKIIDLDESLDLDIQKIATSLSRIYRWNGHCPITVAQHCVMVSDMCQIYKKEALMHDVVESLIGDIISPIKYKFPELIEFENKVIEKIFAYYNLVYPIPEEVKYADKIFYEIERKIFFEGKTELLTFEIWNTETAKDKFINKYYELGV